MTPAKRQARCPVCGATLPASPWRCERCDTPHHADCAEYFGGCAIFGCRDGRPPARLETRQWPEAVSAMRSLGACRTVQDVLLTVCVLSFAIALFVVALPSGFHGLLAPLLYVFLGSFFAYALLDAIWAESRWRLLQELLALGNRRMLEVPRERLRSVLPSTRSRFGWLDRTGKSLFVLGLLALPLGVEYTTYIAFLGFLLSTAANQLGVHRAQLETFQHRLEATYAPALPEKPKPE